MICPACQANLTEMTIQGVTLDVCHGGCGGIWFDQDELEKLNESMSAEDFVLKIPYDPRVEVDFSAGRICPRCANVTMAQTTIGGDGGVTIDSCKACGGTWLDHGELAWFQEH